LRITRVHCLTKRTDRGYRDQIVDITFSPDQQPELIRHAAAEAVKAIHACTLTAKNMAFLCNVSTFLRERAPVVSRHRKSSETAWGFGFRSPRVLAHIRRLC
jgi:hypothetical protein